MFPTGTREPEGELGDCRLGIGKLVAESEPPPVVVPFYHHGMDNVMKRGEKVPVAFGTSQLVEVGEEMRFDAVIESYRSAGRPERELQVEITRQVGVVLGRLQKKTMEKVRALETSDGGTA